MSTSNRSLLGVTQALPQLPAEKRECRLLTDPIYGYFIKYSGEITRVELGPSFINDLLDLIPQFALEDFPKPEGLFGPSENDLPEHILLHVDHDPEALIDFINRWGMVGRISQLFESPMYSDYYPQEGLIFDDPNLTWEEKIYRKEIIPYDFVVDELIRMARCVRFVLNLLLDSKMENDEFQLSLKTRKRLIAAWGFLPRNMLSEKDITRFKPLNDVWLEKTKYMGSSYKYVEMAEIALFEFSQKMNTYLRPMSEPVIRTKSITHIYQNQIGLETALASYLLHALLEAGTPLQCVECKRLYFPERRREDAKYCTRRCSGNARTRKYRKNKSSSSEISKGK